jgi:hypothetical protein
MNNQSEFYVGYLPIPRGLKKVVRAVVVALGVTVAAIAILLVLMQRPFAAATFEFHEYWDFQGVLLTKPYPTLAVPGEIPWLLAGPGKHGVSPPFPEGRTVRFRGERIYRGDDHVIETLPGSWEDAGSGRAPAGEIALGTVQFTGEMVDSKCFFGVMNPGNGKVHRDCAARCISGGIPPAFLVRDGAGRTQTLLLANWRRELLDHIAEPVTIRGRLVRSAGRLVLYAE